VCRRRDPGIRGWQRRWVPGNRGRPSTTGSRGTGVLGFGCGNGSWGSGSCLSSDVSWISGRGSADRSRGAVTSPSCPRAQVCLAARSWRPSRRWRLASARHDPLEHLLPAGCWVHVGQFVQLCVAQRSNTDNSLNSNQGSLFHR